MKKKRGPYSTSKSSLRPRIFAFTKVKSNNRASAKNLSTRALWSSLAEPFVAEVLDLKKLFCHQSAFFAISIYSLACYSTNFPTVLVAATAFVYASVASLRSTEAAAMFVYCT